MNLESAEGAQSCAVSSHGETKEHPLFSFLRALIPFARDPRSRPTHLPKSPSLRMISMALGSQEMNLEETQTPS